MLDRKKYNYRRFFQFCSIIFLISDSVIFFSGGAVDRRSGGLFPGVVDMRSGCLFSGVGVAVLELSFGVADTSGRLSSSLSWWDDAAASRAAARRFDLTRSDILYCRSSSVQSPCSNFLLFFV